MSKIRPLEKNDQNRVHELFLFLNTREPVLFDVDEFINDPNCHCIVV
jgi:hypothetical protein